ncbi:MAG: CinA family protein [Pedobacter sp.]|nr:MAG: CinA family protein [Pedobacter sp.]
MNSYLIRCGKLLTEKKLTIALAESATAGRMAAEFSLLPNAGEFLKGGVICYDALIKEKHLKVSPALIEKYTPESAEVTKAAAKGLVNFMEADIHIAVTGLPSSGGSETIDKPVGTMFISAIYNGNDLFDERVLFTGKPEEIILQTISHTAKLLVRNL